MQAQLVKQVSDGSSKVSISSLVFLTEGNETKIQ